MDEKEALRCLPERIEAELMMAVHLETLKHVRIFQGVEPGLLVDLVLKLRLQVLLSGSKIVSSRGASLYTSIIITLKIFREILRLGVLVKSYQKHASIIFLR